MCNLLWEFHTEAAFEQREKFRHKYGKDYRVYVLGQLTYVITSPDAAEARLFSTHSFFCHFKNLFENNVYFFCSIFFAKSVLSDPEISSKGQIYKFMHNLMGTGLLTSNGDKWQKRRRMLGPFYRSNRYLDIYLMIFQLRIYLIKYWNIIAMEVFTHH